jgi:hypothetical protein
MANKGNIIECLEGLGGNRWQKYGKDRVYFNAPDLGMLLGLYWTTYKTGNIKYCERNGEKISNTKCREILNDLNCKLHYDILDGAFYWYSGVGCGGKYTDEVVDVLKEKCLTE